MSPGIDKSSFHRRDRACLLYLAGTRMELTQHLLAASRSRMKTLERALPWQFETLFHWQSENVEQSAHSGNIWKHICTISPSKVPLLYPLPHAYEWTIRISAWSIQVLRTSLQLKAYKSHSEVKLHCKAKATQNNKWQAYSWSLLRELRSDQSLALSISAWSCFTTRVNFLDTEVLSKLVGFYRRHHADKKHH